MAGQAALTAGPLRTIRNRRLGADGQSLGVERIAVGSNVLREPRPAVSVVPAGYPVHEPSIVSGATEGDA